MADAPERIYVAFGKDGMIIGYSLDDEWKPTMTDTVAVPYGDLVNQILAQCGNEADVRFVFRVLGILDIFIDEAKKALAQQEHQNGVTLQTNSERNQQ